MFVPNAERTHNSLLANPSGARATLSAIGSRLFKRRLFGYGVRAVDEAIAARDAALATARARASELDRVANVLAERVIDREREVRARDRLLESLLSVLGGISGASRDDAAEEAGEGAAANGSRPGAAPHEVFEGLVEVEVGPLADFAQLVGFEDAAEGIGATAEISVKRFAKGRATLEMSLREPVELLRELEERAPFEFHVRDTRDGRVVLDLEGE